MAFKKGDVVVCVDDNKNKRLVKGATYTIHDHIGGYVYIEGIVSLAHPVRHISFFPHRFELKEEKKPEPVVPAVYEQGYKFKGDEFKAGDKVVIRNSFHEPDGVAGDIVTIIRFYEGMGTHYINFRQGDGRQNSWAAWRFSPINPEPAVAPILEEGAIMAVAKKAPLKVGDKVKCSKWRAGQGYFSFVDQMEPLVGKVGVITKILDGGYRVKHKGDVNDWAWNKNNVVLHTPKPRKPAIAAPYVPKVGDKVITNKFAEYGETKHGVYMASAMVKLEGMVGVIINNADYQGHKSFRVNHNGEDWVWPICCLVPADKAKKAPKALAKGVAAVPPPKPVLGPDNGLREAINKKIGDNGNPGCCTYGWQYAKSKENGIFVAAICHANLNRYGGGLEEIAHLALHLRRHYEQSANKKEYKEYVKYVLNDSPFKDVCLTKNVEEAITLGVLLDVTKTASEVASTAVVLRQASEFPTTLTVWKECKANGATDHEAYIISTLFHETRYHVDMGHSLYCSTTTVRGLVNLIKKGVKHGQGSWGKDGGRYAIYNSMNREGGGVTVVKALEGLVSKQIGEGWQKKFKMVDNPIPVLIAFWRGALA